MRDFFRRLRTEFFYCLNEEIEPAFLGMSLTALGEVSRPVLRFSIVAFAIISNFSSFDFLARKKGDQTDPRFLINCQFSDHTTEK